MQDTEAPGIESHTEREEAHVEPLRRWALAQNIANLLREMAPAEDMRIPIGIMQGQHWQPAHSLPSLALAEDKRSATVVEHFVEHEEVKNRLTRLGPLFNRVVDESMRIFDMDAGLAPDRKPPTAAKDTLSISATLLKEGILLVEAERRQTLHNETIEITQPSVIRSERDIIDKSNMASVLYALSQNKIEHLRFDFTIKTQETEQPICLLDHISCSNNTALATSAAKVSFIGGPNRQNKSLYLLDAAVKTVLSCAENKLYESGADHGSITFMANQNVVQITASKKRQKTQNTNSSCFRKPVHRRCARNIEAQTRQWHKIPK